MTKLGTRFIGYAAGTVMLPTVVHAHGYAPIGPRDLLEHWTFDPVVLLPLLALHLLYGRGLSALRRRHGRLPHALPSWRVWLFVMGELSLLLALASPLHPLTGTLLSAHMVQHVILIAMAPLLLTLGRPGIALLHGLPHRWQHRLVKSRAWGYLRRLFDIFCHPLVATFLHGIALWAWHAPVLFEAAAGDDWLHRVEHASFLGTALLFWRAVLNAAKTPETAFGGMASSLVTLVHGGFLSALLSLSPSVLYPAATRWAPVWGLSPLGDQQLAGVIMWVPAGAVYLGAGLWLAARLLGGPRRIVVSPHARHDR